MICEGCGCVFCWDEAGEGALGGIRKRYCSTECQKKSMPSRRRRGQRTDHAGYGPPKVAYESEMDAWQGAARQHRKQGDGFMRPYECPCGSWHLTSGRSEAPTA